MSKHICPWWLGYFLISPLRKLRQDPDKIFAPYALEGATALDIGCGMGYFSLPLAHKVGESGKVFCVDLQEKMIRKLEKRVKRAGLEGRIKTSICPKNSVGLEDMKGKFDFILAFAVVHELPDGANFFREAATLLKPEGKLLLSEPAGHVSYDEFQETLKAAEEVGLKIIETPSIKLSHAALMAK